MGRLARDPDVRTSQSGRRFARMTLAVDRPKAKDGTQKADFIGLIAWERTADFAGQYLSKGRQILVEGRIQTGSYEKDGQKVYTTDVICDRIEFAGSRPQGDNAPAPEGEAPGDEDIPF